MIKRLVPPDWPAAAQQFVDITGRCALDHLSGFSAKEPATPLHGAEEEFLFRRFIILESIIHTT